MIIHYIKKIVSGNYIIGIYNSKDDLVFSRKFCVFEKKSDVNVSVFRLQNMKYFQTHQSIHFTINPLNIIFREPEKRIHTTILKNSPPKVIRQKNIGHQESICNPNSMTWKGK